MRTLTFTHIADSRFTSDLISEFNRLKYETAEELDKLKGVKFRWMNQRVLNFKDGTTQRRITFHVQKQTRSTTWNDVYKAVNSVKASPYTFCKAPDISKIETSSLYQQV